MSLSTLIHRSSQPCPEVSEQQAATLLREHFGLSGSLQALGSQQDLNFLIDSDHGRYVLKVCHGAYAEQELQASMPPSASCAIRGCQCLRCRLPDPVSNC